MTIAHGALDLTDTYPLLVTSGDHHWTHRYPPPPSEQVRWGALSWNRSVGVPSPGTGQAGYPLPLPWNRSGGVPSFPPRNRSGGVPSPPPLEQVRWGTPPLLATSGGESLETCSNLFNVHLLMYVESSGFQVRGTHHTGMFSCTY